MKIHAKCYQISHKTMAYGSSYIEDNKNQAPLTLSVLPWEN